MVLLELKRKKCTRPKKLDTIYFEEYYANLNNNKNQNLSIIIAPSIIMCSLMYDIKHYDLFE